VAEVDSDDPPPPTAELSSSVHRERRRSGNRHAPSPARRGLANGERLLSMRSSPVRP
jgi:hypothetical protein